MPPETARSMPLLCAPGSVMDEAELPPWFPGDGKQVSLLLEDGSSFEAALLRAADSEPTLSDSDFASLDQSTGGQSSAASLRCLDVSHSAECSACFPPPPPDQHSRVCLSGNAIKPLRRLLLLTPEWMSAEAREQAAVALEPLGLETKRTVANLRTRCSRDLSKGCLAHLCYLWGYKSESWVLKSGARKRSREPAAAAAAAAAAPSTALAVRVVPRLPLPSLCSFESGSLRGFVSGQLQPLLRASSEAFEGLKTKRSTVSGGVAPFTLESLAVYAGVSQLCHVLGARWSATGAAQKAWASPALRLQQGAGAGAAADAVPAWQLIPCCSEAGDARVHIAELAELLRQGSRLQRMHGARQLLGDNAAPVPAFETLQDEYSCALRDGSAFHAAATLLLAQLSVACTLSDYVTGAEAVLEAAAAYMTDVGSAYKRRREWGSEVLRSRGTVVLQMEIKQEKAFERYFGKQVEEVLGGMDWSEWRVGERGGGGGASAGAGSATAARPRRGVVISE